MELDVTKALEEQADQLAKFIGGNPFVSIYNATTREGIEWICFNVHVPLGTSRTWRTRYYLVKLFIKSMSGII